MKSINVGRLFIVLSGINLTISIFTLIIQIVKPEIDVMAVVYTVFAVSIIILVISCIRLARDRYV